MIGYVYCVFTKFYKLQYKLSNFLFLWSSTTASYKRIEMFSQTTLHGEYVISFAEQQFQ